MNEEKTNNELDGKLQCDAQGNQIFKDFKQFLKKGTKGMTTHFSNKDNSRIR